MNNTQQLSESSSDGELSVVKRRVRKALSCQRCRKQRSKCSRTRPCCEQCALANVKCEYLEVPGDLEGSALRNRFARLEDQIHAIMNEFDVIEQMVYDTRVPGIRTDALSSWRITPNNGKGLRIDTNMPRVEAIYTAILQFALDNARTAPKSPILSHRITPFPALLTRNHKIFNTVDLSHFNSVVLWSGNARELMEVEEKGEKPTKALPRNVVRRFLKLYNTCLLHGSIQTFDSLFHDLLMDHEALTDTPALQLLLSSCIAYILLHASCWHAQAFLPEVPNMTNRKSITLSCYYFQFAKELLSTLYFEEPNIITCHAICNMALYEMEKGNTSAIYMYTGMAIRLASSLRLYCDDALDQIARDQVRMVPALASIDLVRQYTYAVRFLLFFLDTNVSHCHDRSYGLQVDGGISYDPQQSLFQWLEFQICQITRDIRITCFEKDQDTIPYNEILRIEERLRALKTYLPELGDTRNTYPDADEPDFWLTRCYYMHRIRYYGQWILLHHTYIPEPISVDRCTEAAFCLVDLFGAWNTRNDCYFRPCIHELGQAFEILRYHVDNDTVMKERAMQGLECLMNAILQTPWHDLVELGRQTIRPCRLYETPEK